MTRRFFVLFLSAFLTSLLAEAQPTLTNSQNFGTAQLPSVGVKISITLPGSTIFNDIVVASGSDLRLLRNSDGSVLADRFEDKTRQFFPNSMASGGSSPEIVGLVAGDLNGDQLDDLVIHSIDTGTFPYLRTISFSLFDPVAQQFLAPVFLVSDNLADPAVADVNGDGLKDVVILDGSGTTVTVTAFLQVGSGTFSTLPLLLNTYIPTSPTSTGYSRFHLNAGDLDGDLDDDLVVSLADNNDAELYSLRQNAVGFTSSLILSIPGISIGRAEIVDIDSNGLNDLVFVSNTLSWYAISTLLNQGSNWQFNLVLAPQPAFFVGDLVRLAFGDLQSDGDLDIVASIPGQGATTSALRVLVQTSPVSYIDQTNSFFGANLPFSSSLFGPQTPMLSDFNLDSKLDLVLPNTSDGPAFFAGTGNSFENRTFTHGLDYRGLNLAGLEYRGRCEGELTGNAFQDIAIMTDVGVVLSIGDGAGNFRGNTSIYSGPTSDACVVFDADADGDRDIFIPRLPQSTLLLNGGGGTSFNAVAVNVSSQNIAALAARDVNADGRVDVVMVGAGIGSNVIALNLVSGLQQVTFSASPNADFKSLELVDIDSDGDTDILVLDAPGPLLQSARLFSNNGMGIPSFTESIIGSGYESFAAADINNDSLIDIVAISASPSTVQATALMNLGAGGFAPVTFPISLPPGFIPAESKLAIADYNADGFADVAVFLNSRSGNGFVGGQIVMMANDRVGGFISRNIEIDLGEVRLVTAADVDNDGDSDLIVDSSIGVVYGNALKISPKVLLSEYRHFLASPYLSVGGNSSVFMEFGSEAPAIAILFASLDPVSPGIPTPFGLLRLTNAVSSISVPLATPGRQYVSIPISLSPSHIGAELNLQVVFVEGNGRIRLSSVQSVKVVP